MKRHFNFLNNIIKSNVHRLEFPYKLTFCLTYHCNYRCNTCNIWQKRPENELDKDSIAEFFKKSNGFNWIDLTGGEVWLRKDFVDIVDIVLRECKHLILLHFPTNGFLTDVIVKGVKEILKMKPPKFIITVSMDGDEETNDRIRGKKGGWNRQLETYKKLHEISGVDVVLGMTVSSMNLGAYEDTFKVVKKECSWLKPKDFHMNIAQISNHVYGNTDSANIPTDTEKIIAEVEKYRRLRGFSLSPVGFLEWSFLKNSNKYLINQVTPMNCHALRSSCFIDPCGNVYPCIMYDKKIANIKDYNYDLKRIWILSQTKELQKQIWKNDCPNCWTSCEAIQSILGNLFRQKHKFLSVYV